MSVVIVGGHDRMAGRYKEICRKYDCKAKVFTQMPAKLGTEPYQQRKCAERNPEEGLSVIAVIEKNLSINQLTYKTG